MKNCVPVIVTHLVAFLLALIGEAHNIALLELVQTIPIPGVRGHMDHISMSIHGRTHTLLSLENSLISIEQPVGQIHAIFYALTKLWSHRHMVSVHFHVAAHCQECAIDACPNRGR
jgi:hypothetical protein